MASSAEKAFVPKGGSAWLHEETSVSKEPFKSRFWAPAEAGSETASRAGRSHRADRVMETSLPLTRPVQDCLACKKCASGLSGSGFPFADEPREIRQTPAFVGQGARRGNRLLDLLPRAWRGSARRPTRPGRSPCARRRPCPSLAERRRVGLDVEQVVLDLEGEADRACRRRRGARGPRRRPREEPADGERRADQAAGLALVDPLDELLGRVRLLPPPRGPRPGRRSCRPCRSRRRPSLTTRTFASV